MADHPIAESTPAADELGHYEPPIVEGGQGNSAHQAGCAATVAAACFTIIGLVVWGVLVWA